MTIVQNGPLAISRRDFLFYSCAASTLFIAPFSVVPRPAFSSQESEYYVVNRKRFVSSFEETKTSAKKYLAARYDADTVRIICNEAQNQFEKLLPALPYIGGDFHPGTKWILLAAHWLSFYGPMKKNGYQVWETGRMMYDLYVQYLDGIPLKDLKNRGIRQLSQAYMENMKIWADNKNTAHKNDWQANFVPGSGDAFEYGMDYVYCPCFEFFKVNDAKQLAPYFCLVDFPEHQRMDTGLVRSKTLALGDKICDFRFKKGRAVLQDWSTEVPKIQSIMGT